MKHILYIGNKLSKHGYSVTSLETLGPLLEKEGYKMYYASDKLNFFLRLTDMLFAVWKFRKKNGYVLIDTYSKKSFWGTVSVTALCKLLDLKYILFLHGGSLPDNVLKKKPGVSRFVFNGAYRLVAPSGYLKYEFEKHGYSPILIPNNINIDDYKFKRRSEVKPYLLYVRAFHETYNPEMAIKVLKALKKDFPDTELCMVGPDKDGSMKRCKKLAEELGVVMDVTFTGKIPKKEWHKLSEDYDIFINTTNVDNTPVSVIEAMALGLPVISTNVGGIPYLLEDGEDALLINKGDIVEMADRVRELCLSPNLAEYLSVNGRKKVESFDWNVVRNIWIKTLT